MCNCSFITLFSPLQSEEDRLLQEELNMLVERLQESNADLYKPALEQIRSLIRSSTTSMTSVPKPLKFMRPHYQTMKVGITTGVFFSFISLAPYFLLFLSFIQLLVLFTSNHQCLRQFFFFFLQSVIFCSRGKQGIHLSG